MNYHYKVVIYPGYVYTFFMSEKTGRWTWQSVHKTKESALKALADAGVVKEEITIKDTTKKEVS